MQVEQIDHLTIVVKDLEATRRFYVDWLGMTQVPRPAFDFEGLWFQAGPTLLHVILEHDRSGPAGINEDGREKTSRGPHFAFSVSDALAAQAELEQHGARFLSRAKQRPDGATQVFVFDPDGHVIELASPPPA